MRSRLDGRRFVISERREHVETLAESLSRSVKNVIVFHGRMGVKQRRTAQERLAAIPHDEERVIVATGAVSWGRV